MAFIYAGWNVRNKVENMIIGTLEFHGEKYKKASRHQKKWGDKRISELLLNGTERLPCGFLMQKIASCLEKEFIKEFIIL